MPRKSKGPHPFRVTVIRYVDADGRRCRSSDPGAQRVRQLTDAYYADFFEGKARDRVPLETDNLAVAWERLRALLKRRHEEALGIRDAFSDAAAKDLASHVDDWLATVKAGGTTDKQILALRHGVEVLIETAGWKRITDITHETALLALARIQQPTPEQPKGRSAQTRNHFRSHIRQFAAWLASGGKLRADPLQQLDRVDVSTDRRHDRRTPTDDEVAKLFEVLARPDAAEQEGMTAAQRALGYRLAMATGLRASELRALGRHSFNLDRAAVTVPASYSKRRREDCQRLPPWLVAMLQVWLDADGGLWEGFPAHHPGKVLQLDLVAAGIPYSLKGPGGNQLFFDFHSLRHWYCTWAAHVPGISPRTLLALTRHSTVELAMGTYGVAQTDDVHSAVDGMPEPGKQKPR